MTVKRLMSHSHISSYIKVFAASVLSVSLLSEAQTQSVQPGFSVPQQQIRAQLSALRKTVLSSEVPGVIKKISVEEAGRFSVGELLIELDCDLQLAQHERALAELASAEAVMRANNRLSELDSIGRLDVELAQSATMRAMAEVKIQEVLLDKCQLRAPFSGRVAELLVDLQQYVQAGQPVIDVFDDTALELEFIVPSMWLSGISVGQSFQVSIDETGKTYVAQLKRIGARADPISQTVKVAAEIIDAHTELMVGMSGSIYLEPQ